MRESTLTTVAGETVRLPIVEQQYIDGSFVDGGGTLATVHPPTGEPLADLPVATAADVDDAVAAANAAAAEWQSFDHLEQARRVEAFADAIEDHHAELIRLEVADNGSCRSLFERDAQIASSSARHYAGLATELKGQTIPTPGETFNYTQREPYGVIGDIVPFNHPLMFAAKDIAAALTAGNTIVLKPSEYTSLSTLYLAYLIDEGGMFPDGAVNIVTGGPSVGEALVQHPDIDLNHMRGSSATGKAILESGAQHLTPLVGEMGGKNPVIVYPDTDVEAAIEGTVTGMGLPWEGQSCASGSRLLVHESLADEVVAGVVERFESARIGDPFDADSEVGSLVSETQYERVLDLIETGVAEGGTVLCGGGPATDVADGYYVEPTVVEVSSENVLANEEVFGPVLSVMRWSEYDEMISLANGVDYGLTASVWTNDIRTAKRTIDDLEVGYVWVNQHGTIYPATPFGGFKESGLGKHGGLDELFCYTREKNVNFSLEGDTLPNR
ncbi:aldehyde dehydrogenase family protein [Halobellus salinisoli]|uniref:aldehyde dehydrogenase family protein n=1 Tax=Halobellus salinisoli TaxID=3108500 RepID=UPI00300A4B45